MLQAVGQYPTKDEEKKLIKDHSDGKLITAKQFYSMVKVSLWVASPHTSAPPLLFRHNTWQWLGTQGDLISNGQNACACGHRSSMLLNRASICIPDGIYFPLPSHG